MPTDALAPKVARASADMVLIDGSGISYGITLRWLSLNFTDD